VAASGSASSTSGLGALPSAIGIAAILLGSGVLFALTSAPTTSQPPSGITGACGGNAQGPCVLANQSSTWELAPPASWCEAVNSTQEWANGSLFNSTEYRCQSVAIGLTFNVSSPAALYGVITVGGPFSVWLFPAADWCGFFYQQTGAALPCPILIGPATPADYWNETVPSGGTLDLGTFPFDWGDGTSVFPSGLWDLAVVDSSGIPETAVASTTLLLLR